MAIVWMSLCAGSLVAWQDPQPEQRRSGYVVRVPLPLVGERDVEVGRQLKRLSEAAQAGSLQRPVVVLEFFIEASQQPSEDQPSSRGSQFERCLALARTISDRSTSNLRMVAYLADSVEGHAVLPVLACQEIYAKDGVELGRAAVDTEADATILAAYQDMASRGRTNIPQSAITAMLTPNIELQLVSTTDSATPQVVTLSDANRLAADGLLAERMQTVWNGLGLAAFSSQKMRSLLWISQTVDNVQQLSSTLGVEGGLRTVKQLPREWNAVSLRLEGALDRQRVNQIIRSLNESLDSQKFNLLVVTMDAAECDFETATRLASALGDIKQKIYTACYVESSLVGPVGLVAAACNEVVLIGTSTLGPKTDQPSSMHADGATEQRVVGQIASIQQRPVPLLLALIDRDAEAMLCIHQISGRRELFTSGQLSKMQDQDKWRVDKKIAGGDAISQEVALQYGLVNAVEPTTQLGLSRLGLDALPPPLSTPWLDASIQQILAQPWVPRLMLTIGLLALMIELSNPGISLGGLVAGLCFLGYFWIEGLNGNVEWLEILLFLGGIMALAIEIFVIPGFGIFGITGLMMVFLSLVLAGQTFVWPGTSAEVTTLASNLFWVALMGFAAIVGLLLMHKRLERLPVFSWLALKPGGLEELEELESREAVVSYDFLLGQVGTTRTRLNPSGKAQFGDHVLSVVGSGGLIDAGTPVQVVEVRGNLVIVEEHS